MMAEKLRPIMSISHSPVDNNSEVELLTEIVQFLAITYRPAWNRYRGKVH